jgi:exopolysaccharide biosynthesis polyprenyl glycosylphosphotransferase
MTIDATIARPLEAAPSHAAARGRHSLVLLLTGIAVDVVAVGLAYFIAAVLRFRTPVFGNDAPVPSYWPILAATVAIWPVVFACAGLYDHRRLSAAWLEIRRIFGAVNLAMLFVIVLSFFFAHQDLSRGWTVAAWPACLVTVVGFRLVFRKVLHAIRARGWLATRVVVVGVNEEARSIARTLTRHRRLGWDPVGFVLVSNGVPDRAVDGEAIDGIPVIGWTRHISDAVRYARAEAVLVASTAVPSEKLASLYRDLQESDVDVRISAGILNMAASRVAVEPLDGLPVLALRRMQLPKSQALIKRAFDVVAAAFVIVLLSPLMAAIAIALRLDTRGPVLFRQRRIGQDGVPFTMLKFRSMFVGAEARLHEVIGDNQADGLLYKHAEDPRITRAGRVIRRWSLDELPQLFNVLVGTMSLVGPRPPLAHEVERYDDWLQRRLHVKPGVTGLWQVNGRHELSFEDYVRYDLFYVRNWSLALDLSILWRTIPAVLSRRGSY